MARASRHPAFAALKGWQPPKEATPAPKAEVSTPITPETHAIFLAAMEGVTPLPASNRAEITRPPPAPKARLRRQDAPPVLAKHSAGDLAADDRLDMATDAPVFLRDGLPRRALADLRRGRWGIQSELDLHGYDQEEARTALARFLLLAHERGHRCVRIIHGRGLSSPGGVSVLKILSRQWLACRDEVLAFCPARPCDGGEGALLALLKSERPRP
ncbi:MAG: Smr/MutS family protein [Zoogloeaceae bacterium]|nr:Smr/MutS family protein [Zoogloeaceae bacterium]